jgi:hypothetical protein
MTCGSLHPSPAGQVGDTGRHCRGWTAAWTIRHDNLCGLDAARQSMVMSNIIVAYIAFAVIDVQMLIENEGAWSEQTRYLHGEVG